MYSGKGFFLHGLTFLLFSCLGILMFFVLFLSFFFSFFFFFSLFFFSFLPLGREVVVGMIDVLMIMN